MWVRRDDFGYPTADVNFSDVSDPNANRHFLWKHYVEYETAFPIGLDLFLQRDDLPRYFEWFFNNMAVVIHHGFKVGVESLDGVTSECPGEAQRWRAIRNMFVNERDGYDGGPQSLWLLQAIPRSWLKPGASLEARQMATHLGGLVDVQSRLSFDGNSLAVSAKLDLAVSPSEVRMRLRSADGRPLTSAKIDGANMQVLEKDTIELPRRPKGEYKIVGYFSGATRRG